MILPTIGEWENPRKANRGFAEGNKKVNPGTLTERNAYKPGYRHRIVLAAAR